MSIIPLRIALIGVLLATLATGCVLGSDGTPTYEIAIDWAFPGGDTCELAQVNSVKIEIFDDPQDDQPVSSKTLACAERGLLIFAEDGSYTIDLTAISNSGENFYFGSVDVTVNGHDQNLGTLTLDPIGSITLEWIFPAVATCSEVGVDKVEVHVYEVGETTPLYSSAPLDCSDWGYSVGDFFLDDYDLMVLGYCKQHIGTVGYAFEGTRRIADRGENDLGILTLDMIDYGCL